MPTRTRSQAAAATSSSSDRDVESKFLKGVAISVWQNSNDPQLSNWSRYAGYRWPFNRYGLVGTTKGPHPVGNSCDFWNR